MYKQLSPILDLLSNAEDDKNELERSKKAESALLPNDIQITNQLFFPLPILSYVAPEEVEQSAFGDVARILQV